MNGIHAEKEQLNIVTGKYIHHFKSKGMYMLKNLYGIMGYLIF